MQYGRPRLVHSLQVVLAGDVADTACVVDLEGSRDNGTTWVKLPLQWSLAGGNNSGDQQVIANQPFEMLRSNVISRAGGTNPTMTVVVTSTDE